MKNALSHPRVSPLILALLSLGISALPSVRAARIPVFRRIAQTTASRRRSSMEPRR